MLRPALTLLVLVMAVVPLGCDRSEDEELPAVSVSSPEAVDGYGWDERPPCFVYTLESDTVQTLLGVSGQCGAWSGDEALLIDLGEGPLLLEMDGTLTRSGEPLPTATPFPLSAIASNGWIAEVPTPTGPGDTAPMVIQDHQGRTVYRISEANVPRWSPDGSRLTFLGNICSGWDQMLLDVRSGELENVTPGIGDWLVDSSQGPQPSMVTLPVYRNAGSLAETTRTIDVLDMTTGALRRMVTIPGSGSLHIFGWNPSGTRLLFSFTRSGKSHLCERPPTHVERVNG